MSDKIASRPKTWNINYGARKKCCTNCGEQCPVATRKCKNCDAAFVKKTKCASERIPKGRTNIAQQKILMDTRAAAMFRDHNVHVLTFMVKSSETAGGRRTVSVDTSATPGWASTFIGDTGNPSNYRETLLDLLKQDFLKYNDSVNQNSSAEEVNTVAPGKQSDNMEELDEVMTSEADECGSSKETNVIANKDGENEMQQHASKAVLTGPSTYAANFQ